MASFPDKPAYDLETRTFDFALHVRQFVRQLPRTLCNTEDAKQVVRSSGSVGANYIEANESLSKKDFRMRLRIARKEAKETRYWLRLIDIGSIKDLSESRDALIKEATEIMLILSAILSKSS
ncbi:four helix bundle protein [Planctomicrobium piriforme]|uniref:Four helix bundle protein n=1 Tax=Planctomicrobium piriforme TaxID=1576369 RepID=A0A1I3AY61_9PLAN|nr:four helix bundle protein [Planctomicrobium piriforme]SFH54922.1 four helix bundle protein [Planctomicrobium piriforme]